MARPGPGRNGRDYAGLVGAILATCLGVGWAGAVLIAALRPNQLGEESLAVLRTVGVALAGALGGYLGVALHERGKRNGGKSE